jgi:hypothetical protein
MGLISKQTNDKYRFSYGGWYFADLESEIHYWEDALGDPEGYDTSEEYAQEQLEVYRTLLNNFETAYEAQRTDKVNYEDGTWV